MGEDDENVQVEPGGLENTAVFSVSCPYIERNSPLTFHKGGPIRSPATSSSHSHLRNRSRNESGGRQQRLEGLSSSERGKP